MTEYSAGQFRLYFREHNLRRVRQALRAYLQRLDPKVKAVWDAAPRINRQCALVVGYNEGSLDRTPLARLTGLRTL